MTFFEEINEESLSGVAYKNITLKKSIISYFVKNGNCTIADLCATVGLSAPKINTILNELINDGLVQDLGKIESRGGRKPNLYGLVLGSGFFLGVDVKQNHLNMGIIDLEKNIVHTSLERPFNLQNNNESLSELYHVINQYIKESRVPKDKILGMGLNLSGRINHASGYSYSFFNFDEEPLSKKLERNLGMRVFLENDSRAMAYGEYSAGIVGEEKDILFINMDYGLGVGIVIEGQLYYGKSGFAGEFGHIPSFNNEIMCRCGKKGCLETEVSGLALTRIFKEKLTSGSTSILSEMDINDINFEHIINAALNDDVLAIEEIASMGEKLGRGIAVLINIFNPELVILGGSLGETGEHIRLPIKSALNKYSLSLVNNDTKIRMSKLGKQSGVIGACFLVRNRLLSTN
ncbi:ROK family transcriptional regulator [Pedobacter yonginense]|uniref:ROK family transcriptional regulator n=1 Tax=Pedobacter yonginense TaxID=651869 RepID=A0A317EI47_9SPHI|nr:ROK family transcriptional regulator [Pedobacter yonginense]PWS26312.1 ROK family transcriptional regulator [Pedobacter yonginense]